MAQKSDQSNEVELHLEHVDKAHISHELFHPDPSISAHAHVSSLKQYQELHHRSLVNPVGFWTELAKEFYWKRHWSSTALSCWNFDRRAGKISIGWFTDAKTNICYNVLDYQIKKKNAGDRVAYYWEGNDPDDSRVVTYAELLKEVCKFANVLKAQGVKRGDRVAIYMPMVIELVVAMLGCARIGAVHSVVFGGFSADSLADRMFDATSEILITADGVFRGTKLINLKSIADSAVAKCKDKGFEVKRLIVYKNLGDKLTAHLDADTLAGDKSPPSKRVRQLSWDSHIDVWWHEVMSTASDECEPVWVNAEEPLFMLYTSGSTGKPKGVVHTSGGYLVYTATTFKYSFDYHPEDIFWCTADIGWITGHSYITYGPLANAATSVMFEGVPTYPGPDRFWAIVAKYRVSKFYTAPTAIRALRKFGDDHVKKHDISCLKVIGTVGEPINPDAWHWYYEVVGNKKCSIPDTYWQTETGGHMITPLPGATPMKAGSAGFPFFGVVPILVDKQGEELRGETEGYLCIKQPWPGIMRTVYGDHERFEQIYFDRFKGYYFTGDGAYRDKDGYYWITGRADDVINVSGHRIGTAEVESALVAHPAVVEAAVVGKPDDEKGEVTYCFVTLHDGAVFNDALVEDLKEQVRLKIGRFAAPHVIQNTPALPKTRSGKIMRRILRRVVRNDHDLGDVSTLADSSVIEQLFANRPEQL
ncbi:acetyl-coenzyme A synthetase, cytoplasmic-like [Corticium candelabrum]|uniref:acetyl-coenzyme A synthetase, cytoplasmic-like n=1 Tax=Corticium candelabrum TaxID=121492 RepID=UPI002E273293|nr:acetyl-coenzyme A synthetase, cytoplasmic-like [Corticium candelabrum]